MILNKNVKISIVMAYYNRKNQLLNTLQDFEKKYAFKYDFEVIIVDDNSDNDQKIDNFIGKYCYKIKLFKISKEEKGDRINPCIAYNKGFSEATGDIVIIQNPECYHIGDILNYTIQNLDENDYFSYSCFNANSFEITNELLKSKDIFSLINNKSFLIKNAELGCNWYNHPTEIGRDTGYHFCSAIYKSKLDLIKGFNENFADGYCFDDDEFLLSIKYNLKLDIKIIYPKELFVIHQYHNKSVSTNCELQDDKSIIKQKWLRNKKLYEDIKNYHVNKNFNYPKLLFLYWDESPMAFLNYLTVKSFNEHHKYWKIIIYTPTKKTEINSWKTNEQSIKYNGKCYFDELKKIDNVIIKKISFDNIGFFENASEVIKSDYFRYYILEKHGGLWSDFDIIYTNSVEDKMNFYEESIIFKCYNYDFFYFPIGLFLTKYKSKFFDFILKKCNDYYNKDEYQSIGALMIKDLFYKEDFSEIFDVKILDNTYYLPFQWEEIKKFLWTQDLELPLNNVGLHWFNGGEESKKYSIGLADRLNNFYPYSFIDNLIIPYICKPYNIIINYNGQNKKLELFIENLSNIYKYYKVNLFIINNHISEIELKNNFKNIKINTESNIEEALRYLNDNDLVFFQDLIVFHTKNIFKEFIEQINDNLDFICINKNIENDNISNNFKNHIISNKFPDILLFKKSSYFNYKISFDEDWNKQKNYKELKTKNIYYLFPKKIPKIIHFYWDGEKMDYLTNLSIRSFVFNNPDWKIYLWMPNIKYNKNISWEKDEVIPPHSLPYKDKDFCNYNDLVDNLGITIKKIDYFNLGLKENINEILKSDIFRWKILHEMGGVWSDMDILFVDRIEKTDFEKYNCKFHDIDFVVSQYQRKISEKKNIDFYYIGFLMSNKNNLFFKKMYEKSLENINDTQYQGVGGDLMKSYFGLYSDINNKINDNTYYANLQSDSVYHYWWGDLNNLFFNELNHNFYNYILTKNNIIGFHWFRGVHLSKIYINYFNYENKIQNFDNFKGPINNWVNFYKNIFHDFNLISNQKKISIVMGYISRLKQLDVTIDSIFRSKHQNFEIIIVNDCQDDLSFLNRKYDSSKIIIIDNSKKNYINPCLSYNIGFEKASGEIIIIQNPECCHIGDLLNTVNIMLKENDYMVFSAYYLNNYHNNHYLYNILYDNLNDNEKEFWNKEKMYNIFNFFDKIQDESCLNPNNKGWCSHNYLNKNYLHFCSAIYKNKLKEIDYFSKDYKDGICFDDDDLVRKVILNNMNYYYYPIHFLAYEYTIPSEYSIFVVHQHHERFSYSDENIKEKWNHNKNIFINNNHIFIKKYIENISSNLNYKIKINNGEIIKLEKNIYNINFYNKVNSIQINIESPNNFEYKFNGNKLILKNNIHEIFNNAIYLVKIYYPESNELCFNDIYLQKNNNEFIYKGRLSNLQFILTNLNLNTTFNINLSIKELEFDDNTILEELPA